MKQTSAPVYFIAFILFAAGIGWLCYTGFSENSVYFLNVSEAKAAGTQTLPKARLFGVVANNSISKSQMRLNFLLADKDDNAMIIPVSFQGAIPDNFKEGAEVIVEGGFNETGNFFAKSLMTKCPSKYKKENRNPKNSTRL